MSLPIIEVRNLSKIYRKNTLNTYATLRDTLVNIFKKQHNSQNDNFINALEDLTFDVYEGNKVGIIGPNGSGKTTLLKVLSGITHPTNGKAILRGRTASLLEVGTGFHGELTGRENIFFNGSILGMKRNEIQKSLDQIVSFAQIEHFLDMPVKYYSSGMLLRLAFSVAAHLVADILFIDEVLAVGDAEFQKKTLNKLNELSVSGRTVLFVSHNLGIVEELCNKCLLLYKGKMVLEGKPRQVIEEYFNLLKINNIITNPNITEKKYKIESFFLSGTNEKAKEFFYFDEEIYLSTTLKIEQPKENLLFTVVLSSIFIPRLSVFVYELSEVTAGQIRIILKLPPEILSPGHYFFNIYIYEPDVDVYDKVENVCQFQILDHNVPLSRILKGHFGTVILKPEWKVQY